LGDRYVLEEKSDYSQALDKDIQEEKIFYLSSLKMTAQEFGIKIREHWKIENQLHWVKDVVLQEDKSRIRSGKAPQNMAIIRSIVINIFRNNGIKSITEGLRMWANNIKYLFGLVILETALINFSPHILDNKPDKITNSKAMII
jgi:predicted transposase YbfD/YdcC